MEKEHIIKLYVFGIWVVFITSALSPSFVAQFTGITEESSYNNPHSDQNIEVVVCQCQRDGTITRNILNISIEECEKIKDNLRSIDLSGKTYAGFVQECLDVFKKEGIIDKDITLDEIVGNDTAVNLNVPIPPTGSDNFLLGYLCFLGFVGLGVTVVYPMLWSSSAIGAGVAASILALGYFPFVGYFNPFTGDIEWTSGVYLGGALPFFGLIILAIIPDETVYFPFIFGIGFTLVTSWVKLV